MDGFFGLIDKTIQHGGAGQPPSDDSEIQGHGLLYPNGLFVRIFIGAPTVEKGWLHFRGVKGHYARKIKVLTVFKPISDHDTCYDFEALLKFWVPSIWLRCLRTFVILPRKSGH